MIVLNEKAWAQQALTSHQLGKKPSETLLRLAKYYLAEGCGKAETKRRLATFLLQCDPSASTVAWSDRLERAVKTAVKYPIINIDSVKITEPEIHTIRGIKSKQLQRLAFTLLCLAKYWDILNPSNQHWVNTPDSDIGHMANIKTSVRRYTSLYSQLRDLGLIRFSARVDSLNVQVCFIQDGDTALEIRDYRNLGYQYLRFCGEPFFECACCGITCKVRSTTGRRQKYCEKCAEEVKIRQSADSVLRRRAMAEK